MPRSFENRPRSPADHIIGHLDRALKTVAGGAKALRNNPAQDLDESVLSDQSRRHVIALMRVDHAGEVAAQALYHGQAVTAGRQSLKDHMAKAAQEENDHLAWCEQRLLELGGHTSILGPVWYAASFTIGAVAGLLGERWNLGFLAETERQVIAHLDDHLKRLPAEDEKSQAILKQMRIDEQSHANHAIDRGASELPEPVKRLMTFASRVMTRSAYWV